MAIPDAQSIRSDISNQPPAYPGKSIPSRPAGIPEPRIVEENNSPEGFKLAKSAGIKPVASLRFPEKDVHLVPIKNTNVRNLRPVGLKGNVSIPIKGEQIFDIGEGIRQPLEARLSRLATEIETTKAPSEAVTTSQQAPPTTPSGYHPVENVKTELERLKDLARKELAKRRASGRKSMPPQETVTQKPAAGQPKTSQRVTTTAPAATPAAPVETVTPTAPVETVPPLPKTEPKVAERPPTQTGATPSDTIAPLASSTQKLMSDAEKLQTELSKLQEQLTPGKPPQEPKKIQVAALSSEKEAGYIAQINQLVTERGSLSNKINDLAKERQKEADRNKANEVQVADMTNTLNRKLQEMQLKNGTLLHKAQELEQSGPNQYLESKHNAEMTKQVATLKAQLQASEAAKQALGEKTAKLEAFLQLIKEGPKPVQTRKEIVPPQPVAASEKKAAPVRIVKPQHAIGKMAPSLTSAPNVINGIVKDRSGMLLSNVIIVIKDAKGEPVRALKSNKIGRFAISTPLPNGIYNLEIESEQHSFDIVQVELGGEVLPPIEVRSGN